MGFGKLHDPDILRAIDEQKAKRREEAERAKEEKAKAKRTPAELSEFQKWKQKMRVRRWHRSGSAAAMWSMRHPYVPEERVVILFQCSPRSLQRYLRINRAGGRSQATRTRRRNAAIGACGEPLCPRCLRPLAGQAGEEWLSPRS